MTLSNKYALILLPATAGFESMKYLRPVFWGFISVIFVQSILPLNATNSKLNQTFILSIRLDYLSHVAMFCCLSVLFRLAYFSQPGFNLLKELSFFGLVIFAAFFSEAIQLFVNFRAFNINDLIANFLGIIMGIPLAHLCRVIIADGRKYVQSASRGPQ